MILAALAAATLARGQDLTRVEIKSPSDMTALMSIPEWRRADNTNGVAISVCTGMMIIKDRANWKWCVPLARTLEFDTEGRLIKASAIKIIGGSFEDSQHQTPESVRKAYFPTDAELEARGTSRKEREEQRKALDKIALDLKKQREREKLISPQKQIQCIQAPPIRPPLSAKSSSDEK